MGTANFRGCGIFGIRAYVCEYDKEWYESEYPDSTDAERYGFFAGDCRYHYEDAYDNMKPLIEEFNDNLTFHKLGLASGYYDGLEIVLEKEPDSEDPEELAGIVQEDSGYFYGDNSGKAKFQKRAMLKYQKECEMIEDWLDSVAAEYGFQKFGVTARFSNGETWYSRSTEQQYAEPANPNEYFFSQARKKRGFSLKRIFNFKRRK